MGTLFADEVVLRLSLGAIAGFFAAIVMDLPMKRQSEGMVPPFTAAAVVLGKPPAEVPEQLARSVHYVAAVLAGVLYGVAVTPLALLVGTGSLTSEALAHVGAGLVVLGFLYAFFGYVVLPRYGREKREIAGLVRRQWLVSATVFVVALLAFVPVATRLFA